MSYFVETIGLCNKATVTCFTMPRKYSQRLYISFRNTAPKMQQQQITCIFCGFFFSGSVSLERLRELWKGILRTYVLGPQFYRLRTCYSLTQKASHWTALPLQKLWNVSAVKPVTLASHQHKWGRRLQQWWGKKRQKWRKCAWQLLLQKKSRYRNISVCLSWLCP